MRLKTKNLQRNKKRTCPESPVLPHSGKRRAPTALTAAAVPDNGEGKERSDGKPYPRRAGSAPGFSVGEGEELKEEVCLTY